MARALLAKPRLLLLDEASSNIDPASDLILQKMVRSEFRTCTKLVVAHRINTIIDADRIIVLDSGRVVECDAPHLLLSNPESQFRHLVEATGEESSRELRKLAEETYSLKKSIST